MKKTILTILITACLCGTASAQISSVTLENQEGSTFYYMVDPKELDGLSAGSPLLSAKVAEFFSSKSDDTSFATLAPGKEANIGPLADGTHLLLGFFAVEGLSDFPVRVLSVVADSQMGNRFYAVFASPALMNVPRGQGRLAEFGSVPQGETASAQPADGAGEVAQAPTPSGTLATFADGYTPESFSRERQGDFSVLPISQSRAWGLTGTRIKSVSATMDSGTIRLSLAAPEGFSEHVSYFFYVFDSRAPSRASTATLELEPRADGNHGACLLWKEGASAPSIIGDVKSDDTTVEMKVKADQLTSGAPTPDSSPTVDVTAGWYDRALGVWEEFYYTTFALEEIPVTR
jgi:hypothetical protein